MRPPRPNSGLGRNGGEKAMLGLWGLGGMHGDIIARSHQAHCVHTVLTCLIIITDTLLTLCSCPGDHPQSTRLCSCQAGGTQLVAALAGASVAPLTSQLAAVLTPHSSLTAPALSSRPPQQLFRERRDVRPGPLRPGPGRAGPSL